MPRKKGFTLIELLVVIAIIAILAAILFPVFLTAKAAANKSKCLNNVKQLAQACIMYEDDNSGGMVPGTHAQVWGDWYSFTDKYLRQMNVRSDGGYQLRGIWMCPNIPRSVSTSNGQELDVSLKRCYGLNSGYLGGDPMAGTKKYHIVSEVVKPTTTVRILEIWNYSNDTEGLKWTKGRGTATAYPYGIQPNLCQPNRCWPPGWHGGSSAVGWCDGHVSWITVTPPRPRGAASSDADYTGVMQKYYRNDPNFKDPYFRLGYPKP